VAVCVVGFGWVVELVIRECLVSVFFFLVQGRLFFFIFSLFYGFFSFSFLSVLSTFSSPELHLYLYEVKSAFRVFSRLESWPLICLKRISTIGNKPTTW
jgi:hypothetical protein